MTFVRMLPVRVRMALFISALLAAALLLPQAARAAYPERPIKMIVPYPPGGATDVIGRVMATALSNALGQQVVVENRGGAGGNLGADAAAKSPADGYTLLMGALTSHSIMATLEKDKLRYNLVKDLTPVCIVGSVPLVFVTHPGVPANTLKELIALGKSRPGYLTYASSGAGAPQRMAAELFKRMSGLEMVHVPYKGSGPAMTDLVGGQVLTMAETVPASLQFIKAGKLRALAVTTPQRISMLPDVPTAAEAGLPGLEVSSTFGVLVPAGTPQPIVNRLHAELAKIVQIPEVKEQLLTQGVYAAAPGTLDEAARRVQTEIDRWAKVIKDSDIKADE